MMSTSKHHHAPTNSILKRCSQFENSAPAATATSAHSSDNNFNNQGKIQASTPPPATARTTTAKKSDGITENVPENHFILIAFERFKQEFSSLYPGTKLPFNDLKTLNQAKKLLQEQKERIQELSKELNRSKFTAKFLEEIIVHKEKDLGVLNNIDGGKDQETSDTLNNADSATSKEQYVTVITLNDSTYGEIQKVSPRLSNENVSCQEAEPIKEITEPKMSNKIVEKLEQQASKEKPEPIYSNTLETQKSSSDKGSRKRPPTPPRKPKLTNKLPIADGSCGLPLTKSESYSSRSQFQRKFNGPVQQIDKTGSKDTNKAQTAFLRTFSLDQTNADHKDASSDKKSTDESIASNDDNIYDTVAPDSDCDTCDESKHNNISNDEENETSSQEMLSRSSSTDELSNYVNIDYFLRKNSLGRSNSNIPGRLNNNRKTSGPTEESDDNELTMSSIKSSEYDQFGSSDNILRSFQAPSHSLRSFNSMSTNSSGSSLRVRNTKLLNQELSSESYPPTLSTFTPPIREKNHQEFFKDTVLSEKDESSIYSDGSDSNSVLLDKNSSDKSGGQEAEFYAFTDIIDSVNDEKLEPHDESVRLESKSLIPRLEETKDHEGKKTVKPESESSRQMQWNIVKSIIDSETVYLDCLNTLNKYKKAFETASKGENAMLSMEDLNIIFFRIPELFELHSAFLNGLKKVEHGFKLRNKAADSMLASKLIHKQSIGELFHTLAENLHVYADFLRNYSKAIETANRCGANNAKFFEIIKSIKVASVQGQFSNLVDLLHEPVARLQKNALVLYDLLKCTENEEEKTLLNNALKLNQNFLNELNLDAARKLFMTHDKFKRRLCKESFIIESGDRRKLRHLFLFNDVIVSAKYKASSKQKFTFELRWFQMLSDIVLDPVPNLLNLNCNSPSSHNMLQMQQSVSNHQSISASEKESKECTNIANLISNIKSRAFSARLDLFLEEKRKGQSRLSDKLRKKISELESELVLYLPQLRFSFHVKNNPNKSYVFYLSSEYERNCWVDAIKTLQQNASSDEHANIQVLQKWIESCRKSINVNLGSFLLRTNKDETLRYGDLNMRIVHLGNYNYKTNIFIVIETDSFGHYCRRAVARFIPGETNNKSQDFLIELEGSQILRFLLYEDTKKMDDDEFNDKNLSLKGKATLELTSSCASLEPKRSEIQVNEYMLCFETRFTPWTTIMEMIPPNKIYGAFGVSISQVCKKEKSKVPYLILSCINEVERRGLKEVGIYRVSGLSSEVQKLKKAFETNPREACFLIREIDIHSVTGMLKLYLRELPESLFTNDMYQKYFEARDLKNHQEKDQKMTSLLAQLVQPNRATVIKLIEHLALVNRFEDDNKMSLNNLATIFGPTMLRTNSAVGGNSKHSGSTSTNSNLHQGFNSNLNANVASLVINTDLFTASTIDVMAQADILFYFLRRKSEGFSLTSVDQEETSL